MAQPPPPPCPPSLPPHRRTDALHAAREGSCASDASDPMKGSCRCRILPEATRRAEAQQTIQPDLLADLGRRGVLVLLVEGGGVLSGSFFDHGLVDKLHAVIAPMVIGSAEAPSAVAGRGAERMADALRLKDVTVERLGSDILVTGYLN